MDIKPIRILVVAGEVSGDMHGASLISELKKIDTNITFWGIGGDKMASEGVSLVAHVDKMAVMGFTEVIRKYPFLRSIFYKIVNMIRETATARAILIDYPGFNLRLAKQLYKHKVPITYYIPPQLWAWHENRVEIIKKNVDQVISIFQFEEEWFKARGVNATFVGHPFLDVREEPYSRNEFFSKHELDNFNEKSTLIALYPGSRQQEVDRHFPLMLEAITILRNEGENIIGIVGKAPNISIKMGEKDYIKIEGDSPLLPLKFADIAILSSGTITLEAAIHEVLSVVIYKFSPISSWWARHLVKVDYVSMPNLIAGREVYPELLLDKATTRNIVTEVKKILYQEEFRTQMFSGIGEVKKRLGCPGASKRAAELIYKQLMAGSR